MGKVYSALHEEIGIPINISIGKGEDKCPTCQYPMSVDLSGRRFCRTCEGLARSVIRHTVNFFK